MAYETFDEKIHQLRKYSEKNKTVTLWEIATLLGHSSLYILSAVLVVPFLQPIPLLGFSTILGAVVIFAGLLIFAGMKLLLPDFAKRYTFSQATILKLCKSAEKLSDKMKYFIHPRGRIMLRHTLIRRTTGLLIAYCGILLALPLPFPGTNTFPALAIFIMSLASLEEDGIALIIGYFFAFLATMYLWFVVVKPIEYLLKR